MQKKVEQISNSVQNYQVVLLMDVKADSYAHCEQVMEEEFDFLKFVRESKELNQP